MQGQSPSVFANMFLYADEYVQLSDLLIYRNIVEIWGIAQLGERLNGIQEVSGSIPLISTKTNHKANALWFAFYKEK